MHDLETERQGDRETKWWSELQYHFVSPSLRSLRLCSHQRLLFLEHRIQHPVHERGAILGRIALGQLDRFVDDNFRRRFGCVSSQTARRRMLRSTPGCRRGGHCGASFSSHWSASSRFSHAPAAASVAHAAHGRIIRSVVRDLKRHIAIERAVRIEREEQLKRKLANLTLAGHPSSSIGSTARASQSHHSPFQRTAATHIKLKRPARFSVRQRAIVFRQPPRDRMIGRRGEQLPIDEQLRRMLLELLHRPPRQPVGQRTFQRVMFPQRRRRRTVLRRIVNPSLVAPGKERFAGLKQDIDVPRSSSIAHEQARLILPHRPAAHRRG